MNDLNRSELETAIAKQRGVSDNLSERINEMREQKNCDNSAFQNLLVDFSVSERQVERMEKRLDAITPASAGMNASGVKRAIEASPSVRFIRAAGKTGDGFNGLESWEASAQREMSESKAFAGVYKAGDFIMPIRQEVTTTTVGDAISTDTMSKVVEKLVDFGGARRMAQRMSTSGGNPLKFPTSDESTAEGAIVGEGAEAGDYDHPNFGNKTINAFTYTSKGVDLSKEAISDTDANGFDLIGWAMRQAARRIGRITNTHFTVGSGTNQPQGMMTSAGAGVTTAASGGAANITYADLVKMVQSIDPAYLDGMEMGDGASAAEGGGIVGWQFHQAFETILMSMVDGDGRSLWSPGLTAISGTPRQSTVLGYPYFRNQAMPSSMAAGQDVALFGNGSYFLVRDVDSVLIRLFDDSGTANTNSVKVLGFARADSRYIGTGTASDAYKKLRTKS